MRAMTVVVVMVVMTRDDAGAMVVVVRWWMALTVRRGRRSRQHNGGGGGPVWQPPSASRRRRLRRCGDAVGLPRLVARPGTRLSSHLSRRIMLAGADEASQWGGSFFAFLSVVLRLGGDD